MIQRVDRLCFSEETRLTSTGFAIACGSFKEPDLVRSDDKAYSLRSCELTWGRFGYCKILLIILLDYWEPQE